MTDILFELAAIEEPDNLNWEGKIVTGNGRIIHPASYYGLDSMFDKVLKHEIDMTFTGSKVFAVKPGSNAIGYSEYNCELSKEQAYIEAVAKFMVMYLSTEPEGGEV